ncbi:MAG: hypothetical protein MRQ07_05385 [Candidatus Midichloria sp.]|nr:hypothetical protein [Candidatus Midichloria sp.]
MLEKLGKDMRTNEMCDNNQYYPAAFVRDRDGNITSRESIYFNKETANKADIAVNKLGDHDNRLQEIQDAIKALARFGSKEDINTGLQMCKEKDINSLISYSKRVCTKAIERKIQKDLQIMNNKFDPNYNLGD